MLAWKTCKDTYSIWMEPTEEKYISHELLFLTMFTSCDRIALESGQTLYFSAISCRQLSQCVPFKVNVVDDAARIFNYWWCGCEFKGGCCASNLPCSIYSTWWDDIILHDVCFQFNWGVKLMWLELMSIYVR